MTDVLAHLDKAHIESIRLWTKSVKEFCSNSKCSPISYKKYRVLKSISKGNLLTYDISDEVYGVTQTVAVMLNGLFMEGLVTRDPINGRTFRWGLTLKGFRVLEGLEKIVMQIRKDILTCIEKNLIDVI